MADNETYDPTGDGAPLVPPVPAPAPAGPRARGPRQPAQGFNAERAMSSEDQKDVFSWMKEISSQGEIKIKLERLEPERWEGTFIKGWCAEYDRFFEESEIRERFGGGRFQITVRQATQGGGFHGGWKRTFNIGGNPKVTGEMMNSPVTAAVVAPPTEPVTATVQAMNFMAGITKDAQARADRAELRRGEDGGSTDAIVKMMEIQMKGLNDQLLGLQRSLAEKDAKILELIGRPPPQNMFQEKILANMLEGETARITALRANHESEVRQKDEIHQRSLDRERERFSDELRSKDKQQERELQSLRDSHASMKASAEQAHESRVEGLKGRITDLDRALTEARTELAEMRARKEKGPMDAVSDVLSLKNALDELGMGGSEEGGTAERIVAAIVGSPMAQAIGERLKNAPAAPPPQPQQQQQRRRRQQQQRPQQRTVVSQPPVPVAGPDGQTVNVEQPEPVRIQIDENELSLAIQFMENAARNGTDPADFVTSYRAAVPGSIIAAMRALGIDRFMSEVARIPEGSPLAQAEGRNWLRKVAKYLLGEDSSAPVGDE